MRYFLLVILLLSWPLSAQPLKPVDNTDEAPDFPAFRAQMLQAIETRDAQFFRERTEGAKLSFGLDTSLDEMYRLQDPDDPFWLTLERITSLGGSYKPEHEMVYYPYVYIDFPEELDGFGHLAVAGENVNVRSAPGLAGRVVGTASYEVVKRLDYGEEWVKVESKNGLAGYIHRDFLYSPIDYRMGLKQKDGRWKVVFFVAGD